MLRNTLFSDTIQCSVSHNLRNTIFWKLNLFPSSGEGGSIGRPKLNHWKNHVTLTTYTCRIRLCRKEVTENIQQLQFMVQI
jgi:hypothetical protein